MWEGFCDRKDVFLEKWRGAGNWFPPTVWGSPREIGWAYEPALSCRVQLRAAIIVCPLPKLSQLWIWVWVLVLLTGAPVPCRLCHEAQSTTGSLCIYHLPIVFCSGCYFTSTYLLAQLAGSYPHSLPCANRNCPYLSLEAARYPLLTHCYHLEAWAAKLLLALTHHLSWNRLVNKMTQCEIHLFHQVVLSLGNYCFVLC